MVQNGSEKKKNIASLKHATYKLEEKSLITITNMERGSSDINATYFPVSDFTLTVAFSVNPYKLR